jgi:hypothetical protein
MVDQRDIFTLKARLHHLKHQLYNECVSDQEKNLAHKYLNQVLNFVEELK